MDVVVEIDEEAFEREAEEEPQPQFSHFNTRSHDFDRDKKQKKSVFKRIITAKFPFTNINILLVFFLLFLPLVTLFAIFIFAFPDVEGGGVKMWKWASWGLMILGAWTGFYFLAGFLIAVANLFFPRTQFTYFFQELGHTIAFCGIGTLGYITTYFYLEGFTEKDFLLRGWICVIVVALCYGARKLMERYILLKFARKEYFNSLKKLMFEEKIVFKLLEYKLQKERSKMRKRKKKEREENSPDQFEWGAEEEISPDVHLVEDDAKVHPKMRWVSPTDSAEPPDVFMIHQCEKYSESRRFSFLNYGTERDRLYHLSNELVREQLLNNDIDAVTDLIFKALDGHKRPITVESFAVIFPDKPHRCQAAFALFSGGPLDTSIQKKHIRATVARVFQSRHNASASLQGRGDIAKVLSAFVGLFFWSVMIVVVLLIYSVDILNVAVPYFLVLVAFSLMFGTSIQMQIQAAIFLLVIHPFDVGDRVSINGDSPILIHSFTLAQTIGYRPDGRWESIPNATLFTARIQNYHRSKSYTIDIYIEIAPDTDRAKLEELINDTYALCADHEIYVPGPEVLVASIGHGNALQIEFWVETKMIPWYDIDRNVIIKTNFVLWVMEKLLEKQIKFKEPTLPVDLKTQSPNHLIN